MKTTFNDDSGFPRAFRLLENLFPIGQVADLSAEKLDLENVLANKDPIFLNFALLNEQCSSQFE